ncbi:hybrid sensor histidine kinase/response regulator [Cupriavidus agavae]|uniref:Chemotaxis protein CheA n=1 Tax=Cupriavidus agavae TaxID=1001822 RepID=A0A4Q7S8X4_9BURK|nr:Hpt domain-containing protein [Cupriavidus agavae]RZT42904.1 chemosensory pili system protein ChpA (sensor histidine kinase/response regulator) [Cupriavidus agavae]
MSLHSTAISDAAEPAALQPPAGPGHETVAPAAPATLPAAPARDLSVLAWLAPSLRTALDDAAAELGHYVDEIRQTPEALGARDTTSLRLAGQQLHQAAGAVHIVGLRGVDAYCQALRRLLEAIDAGTVAADAATLAVFRTGVQALAEYVDDLMAGDAEDPLRLFQPFAAALALMKEERVHPADLWIEELQMLPGIVLPTRSASAVTRARQRFEAALLKALRLPTPCPEAALLREAWLPLQAALDEVRNHEQDARRTTDNPDRGIWHALALVCRALAHGLLPSDLLAKRFAARAHLLVRQYLQGQVRVPQALLNDAVFFLVSTGQTPDGDPATTPPGVQATIEVLRADIARSLQAFRIDAAHAVARADHRQRYYGWLDPIDTRNLQHAATAIGRAAGDDQSGWELALASLAEAALPLAQPALQQALSAAAAYAGQRPAGDALGRAGVALFLSRALAMPWRVHGKSGHPTAKTFAEQCDVLAARLADPAAAAPDWLADMVQAAGAQAQRAEALTQLRAQLDSGESWLDTYDRNAARPDAGSALDEAAQAFGALLATLERLHGGAALPEGLDAPADAALAAVRAVLERLGVLRQTEHEAARIDQLSDIAAELGAVHAFADLLEFGRKPGADDPDDPLAWDAAEREPLPQGTLAAARGAAMDAIRVAATADSPEIQRLRAALQTVADQAAIDDNATLRRQASEAATQLNAWLAGSDSAAERLVVALADPMPAAAPSAPQPAPAPLPADAAAIDAELLDIFLSEADEVLGNIDTDLAAGVEVLADADVLSRLRRAFHTLKGSSRMVGLNRYGEAAWAVEQVMNLWIAEARAPQPALLALLRQAQDLLREWALALRDDPLTLRDTAALLGAAQAVREPGEGGAPAPVEAAEGVEAPGAPEADPLDALLAEAAALPQPQPTPDTDTDIDTDSNVLPFRLGGALVDEDDHYKVIGPVRIGLALYNVYLHEADDLLRQFATDLSEWKHENHPCPSELALRVAHTLQGSASTVGLTPVRDIAEALEQLLLLLGRHPVVMHPADFRLLDQAVDRLRAMLHQFAAGIWPDAEPALCRELYEFGERALVRPRAVVPPGQSAGQEGSVAQLFGGQPLPEIGNQAPVAELPAVKLTPITSLPPVVVPVTSVTSVTPIHDAVVISMPAPRHDSIAVAHVSAASPDTPPDAADAALADIAALDPALVDIFLEEAQGALPDLGKLVRTWEAAPAETQHGGLILRGLHTLKGSARMAGAMALGQAAHEMETLLEASVRGQRVTPDLFGKLYAWYDRILAHGEALQAGKLLPVDDADVINGLVAAPAQASGPAQAVVPVQASLPVAPVTPAALPTDAERQRALVRVQARTLDTLINDAGEVGATRARLDSELLALRSYLGELNDNVARLRMQLREIEIQAETQMASRIADAQQNQEFDPLEFDRFTRFQELTRMMAESVNDVATVEQNLQRGFDRASGDLAAQARLTRGLQRGLMQARMVQFDALAERLYRVARQAATETGKEVRLLIKGGTVEIDRSVLDRMAGPIEHLIRNAVVHGIEPAETRRAVGKSATGALTLEVQQEGNEVVLTFFDDGGGLDLGRIRERAVARQLLAADEDASEARLTEMIFAPGFSTADTVSELAGRGVGMDVVRAETVALGGRITLSTEPGRGTSFTVHLPLTTAITQVLLVSLGGRLYAIPSGMIDQVHQLREKPLVEAYNAGRFAAGGVEAPFFYFGALLEEVAAMASGRKYSPVVVVRSGAERVAVHVDDVIGNREVVVKHIGPHLARLEGIAGATTLGDGEIVLIYNPVVLAQRWTRERGEVAPAVPLQLAAPAQMGAVAEFIDAGAAVPVAGLLTQPTVMVVDDSLTVRKASQRLLTRAGYKVVLARDGVDALRQLQEVMPDAMLVDIEMPNMDGFDLTRNVRADSNTTHMPIVMITSRTAEKHRRYAAEIGVNVYLGKPFNEDELLRTLQQLIGEKSAGTAGSVAQMLGEG